MASMSATSNPMGRWWHPLPLMSGVGAMIGSVILKLAGMMELSWWFTIIFPLVADIIVNLLLVGVIWFGCLVADKVEARNRRRKRK